jgi:hypothetical protein
LKREIKETTVDGHHGAMVGKPWNIDGSISKIVAMSPTPIRQCSSLHYLTSHFLSNVLSLMYFKAKILILGTAPVVGSTTWFKKGGICFQNQKRIEVGCK